MLLVAVLPRPSSFDVGIFVVWANNHTLSVCEGNTSVGRTLQWWADREGLWCLMDACIKEKPPKFAELMDVSHGLYPCGVLLTASVGPLSGHVKGVVTIG
jgi:hypothetical protein